MPKVVDCSCGAVIGICEEDKEVECVVCHRVISTEKAYNITPPPWIEKAKDFDFDEDC